MSAKKSKKQQTREEDDVNELTKEETKIARFLRLKCPTKQGNLSGMKVNFFIANKLIDLLMESSWGPNNKKNQAKNVQPYFTSRQACITFMQRMMNKQMFYRAVKVYKDQVSTENTGSDATPNLRKRKTSPNLSTSTTTSTETPSSSSSSPKQKDKDKDNQVKRKFKLEMHEDQKFLDAAEPYVWIYDPTSTTSYIIGLLLILGSIGICLFPLWPSQVREGVYYLSLAGATFLGAILALAILKYFLFGLIWAFTFGKIHFWLFPNLTEDVGFFESFVPVYKFDTKKATSTPNETTKNAEEPSATTSTATSSETVKEMSKSTLGLSKTATTDSPVIVKKRDEKREELTGNEDNEDFDMVEDEDLVKSN